MKEISYKQLISKAKKEGEKPPCKPREHQFVLVSTGIWECIKCGNREIRE